MIDATNEQKALAGVPVAQGANLMIEQWHGCYDSNWNGLIVPDAFAHPAKYAHGLIDRIFRYMLDKGMVAKGDKIVDPFGGIGTGGIVAASLGLQWFGCELEAKFHELGLKNFDLHLMTWQACRDPIPVLVNGDSRKLRENLRGVLAQAVVCSPPFQGSVQTTDAEFFERMEADQNPGPRIVGRKTPPIDYGTTPGQLGAMKAGDVAAVVGSPPFVDPRGAAGRNPQDLACNRQGYAAGITNEFGESPGQLSTLPAGAVDAVVTSPPYEGVDLNGKRPNAIANLQRKLAAGELTGRESVRIAEKGQWNPNTQNTLDDYGTTEGQLGATTSETFWHAARDIVSECHAILRPEGFSAWVVKDFVRAKQRVPFCDDWCKLLEACGFTVTTRVHAMLVKETSHPDLFGGDDHVERTERKSFFRRLAEKKGSPRIDWEEVIFARKAQRPLFAPEPTE